MKKTQKEKEYQNNMKKWKELEDQLYKQNKYNIYKSFKIFKAFTFFIYLLK